MPEEIEADEDPEAGTIGVPAAFAGTWKGKISLTGTANSTATVRLTLKDGAPTGRLKFVELGCSGTVEVMSFVVVLMTLQARMNQDPKNRCSNNSRVSVILLSDDELTFTVVDDNWPRRAGSGTLKR